MEKLIAYLNGLSPADQADFARRSKASLRYLRTAASEKRPLGEALCLRLWIESGGEVRLEDLRADVDWVTFRKGIEQQSQRELARA